MLLEEVSDEGKVWEPCILHWTPQLLRSIYHLMAWKKGCFQFWDLNENVSFSPTIFFLCRFFFKNILKYSWFIVLCQFLLHSNVTQLYICTHTYFLMWMQQAEAQYAVWGHHMNRNSQGQVKTLPRNSSACEKYLGLLGTPGVAHGCPKLKWRTKERTKEGRRKERKKERKDLRREGARRCWEGIKY